MKNSVLIKFLKEINKSNLNDHYRLLFFKDLPILDIINTFDDKTANRILETKSINKRCILICESILKEKFPEEIINMILNNKELFKIQSACSLLNNLKLYKYDFNKTLGFFRLLMEANTKEKTECVRSLLFNTKLTDRDDAFDLLNTIVNAKDNGQAIYVQEAISWIVEKEYTGNIINFLNIIANAYGKAQASLAYSFLSKNRNGEELENYMPIIANAKEIKYEDYIFDYLNYSRIRDLSPEVIIDIANSIANSEGSFQARCALTLAKLAYIYYTKDGVEIIKAIAGAKEEFQAKYAYIAVTSSNFLSNKDALGLIRIIVEIPCPANKVIETYEELLVYLKVLILYDPAILSVDEIINYTSIDFLIERLKTLDEDEEISAKTHIRNNKQEKINE